MFSILISCLCIEVLIIAEVVQYRCIGKAYVYNAAWRLELRPLSGLKLNSPDLK
jgi:hypothetical protein